MAIINTLSTKQKMIKHTVDKVFAAILIVIFSPLLLMIAIVLMLSDGYPIFFIQERLGRNEELFSMWKFRTMFVNADQHLDKQGHITDKPRITRIGKILRYLSFDELPQLFNILKGEMSFVGPRPALPIHLQRYTSQQKRRLLVRPGITGLSQINGRNKLKWSKRIEYDIWYIDNYTLWLDCKILMKTIKVVLLREGVVLDRNQAQVDDLAILPQQYIDPIEQKHDT